MTTRTDTIPVAVAPTGGGFRWRRLFFSFLLTILAIAVFVAAFMIGFVRMHEARALPGVEVAGIAIGGLDRHDAELKLRQELPSLSAGQLTVSFAEYTARIPYADFGRDHNIGLMIDQAFALGHGGSIWDDFRAQIGVLMNGVVVEPSVTWNGDQLVESMQAIAQDVTIYPVDAAIVRETGRYSALPSSEGRSVDIEEGLARALAAIDNTSPASQTIQLDPVVLHPSITTAQAEQAVTRAEQAVAGGIALTGLEGPASIDEATLRGWVYINEALPGTWPVIIEREPIVQYVAQFSEQLYVEPVDATFSFNNEEKIAAVVPGKDGQQLDVATSADRVLAVLEGRVADGSPGNPVSLAIVAVEPNFGTEQAEAMAPRFEKLSAWTTNFVPAETNGFGVNISLPTSEIHGTVLQPGDDFDFLTVIGPITRERGYRSGAGIQRGRTNLDGVLGGGMCSCSTTIFNAALRAGLEMGKRAPHYY
ncbi:MAG TPA: peptidoglycan binding domain-containing protein, partial [Candidatus Limnocylindria bacterium]|nr:peptidoglycan binding domain-containing protein [Candidatus Limnocylindria bacterium]